MPWVQLLQNDITHAIQEVILKPARYIPLPFVDLAPTTRVALSEPDKNMVAVEQQLASIRSELNELRQTKPTEPIGIQAPKPSMKVVPEPADGFHLRASRRYVGDHFAVVGKTENGWMVRLFKRVGSDYLNTHVSEDTLSNQDKAKGFADSFMPDPVAKWKSIREMKQAFR